MEDMNKNVQSTNEANDKINQILEDSQTPPLAEEGLSTEAMTNIKLNTAMNDNHINDSEQAPTYLYNNTPAIKINERFD
ncbi:hypothetical protein [Bacillus marasmi]|uniref:hypothetical protein n=1 Tax=Bacillus marasmi TaxID=1926279 RepID=UPI0011CBAF61|nr:hypothetical protein [Bacillus marasmi]